MSRPLMPKSGAMAPYIVVNRDAAVAGVFSVDGEAGAVVLTSKYLQISNYTIDKEELNTRLTGIDSSIQNNVEAIGNINTAIGSINSTLNTKAAKGANNDITELNALTKAITIAQGGTGSSTLEGAKTALELDRFSQEFETETRIYSGDKNSRLTIQNNGTWGVYSGTENKWLALPVEQGGTGVNNREALWSVVRPQGSTPLAGDPVNDYDAVTKRWVENKISTGTVGPTMNGVMNYGVGDFHLRDSRAYIQPYEVVSDGQLLNRADWPELWAYAQMTSPIEDADWLADPLKRGKYSTGDGLTTFRVPDRNGVQTGSISGLYARGDGGNSANDGTVQQNAAPDITGTVGAAVWSVYGQANGALYAAEPALNVPLGVGSTPALYVGFRAGLSNAAYGRDNTTEVRTNSFIGVWVIRASGGFVAANTTWSVINGDKTAPSIGTSIKGGEIRSDYNIGGSMHIRSSMRADGNYSQRGGGVWRVEDYQGKSSEIRFDLGGELLIPTYTRGWGSGFIASSKLGEDGQWPTTSPAFICELTGRAGNVGTQGATFSMYAEENVGVNTYGVLGFSGAGTGKYWLFDQFGNAIAPGSWISNSDRRIKKDIALIEDPLDKMRKMHGYSWRRIEDDQFGVGFIAQEVQELFPESVYEGPSRTMPDGTVVEGVLSPDTSGVAAALHHEAILALMDQIEELKQEIAVLKASMQTLP